MLRENFRQIHNFESSKTLSPFHKLTRVHWLCTRRREGVALNPF